MRRSAIAAAIPILYVSPVFAQSQVQHVPHTTAETASADGLVPNGTVPENPETTNSAGPVVITPKEREPELPVRRAVLDRDELAGHVRLGAALAYGTFSGNYLSRTPIGRNLGGSPILSVDLGFGLSRQLELVVATDFSMGLAGSSCSECESKSWSIGPMLRYHLVEGTRFDPWLALGVAYRHNSWNFGTSRSMDSLEFTKLAIGGDWFVTSLLTVGPVLSLGLDTATTEHANEKPALFAVYFAGIRVMLDLPGR